MRSQADSQDVVVIGIGCPYRRDDGVGPVVLDRLARMRAGNRPLSDLATLTTCDGDLTRLLGTWEGTATTILVDAAKHGQRGRPGAVRRFDFGSRQLPCGTPPASSHGLGLAEAVALGRALNRLPARLVVYTVEAADTGLGNGLSPAVAAAVDEVAERIAAEIAKVTGDKPSRGCSGGRATAPSPPP